MRSFYFSLVFLFVHLTSCQHADSFKIEIDPSVHRWNAIVFNSCHGQEHSVLNDRVLVRSTTNGIAFCKFERQLGIISDSTIVFVDEQGGALGTLASMEGIGLSNYDSYTLGGGGTKKHKVIVFVSGETPLSETKSEFEVRLRELIRQDDERCK